MILDRARPLLDQGRVAHAAFVRRAGSGTPPPRLSDPAASAGDSGKAMLAAADEMLAVALHLAQEPAAPLQPPAPAQGVIHPLMANQREMQAIALNGAIDGHEPRLAELTAAARRLVEAHRDQAVSFALNRKPETRDRAMVGILQNDPLWSHARDGFQRDCGKLSLPLWGRKQPPPLPRAIGVFLHLHYDELAPVFAERLAASTQDMNRILSFFQTIPTLGLVVPVTYRAVLGAAHWGANHGIARELAHRMGLPPALLPPDNGLRFPVGSMFWARTAALRPVLDLRLQPGHFPPEA